MHMKTTNFWGDLPVNSQQFNACMDVTTHTAAILHWIAHVCACFCIRELVDCRFDLPRDRPKLNAGMDISTHTLATQLRSFRSVPFQMEYFAKPSAT